MSGMFLRHSVVVVVVVVVLLVLVRIIIVIIQLMETTVMFSTGTKCFCS